MNTKISEADLRRNEKLEKSAKKHKDHVEHVLSTKELNFLQDQERFEESLKKDVERNEGYKKTLK